jgi:hypothetical protein
MTPVMLTNAIKELLDEKLVDYTYTDSAGDTRAIKIYTITWTINAQGVET